LAKFHWMSPGAVGARRLARQELVERVAAGAVDLDLGEHREGDAELRLAEGLDLALAARFLATELVAREAEHGEAAPAELLVQLLQPRVLRREAALGRDVDDEQRLARVVSSAAWRCRRWWWR
jgi:hypothetical protein